MGASLKRIRESGNDGEDRTETRHIKAFNMLNEEGQEKAREYMQDLAGVERYQRTEGETKTRKYTGWHILKSEATERHRIHFKQQSR